MVRYVLEYDVKLRQLEREEFYKNANGSDKILMGGLLKDVCGDRVVP